MFDADARLRAALSDMLDRVAGLMVEGDDGACDAALGIVEVDSVIAAYETTHEREANLGPVRERLYSLRLSLQRVFGPL